MKPVSWRELIICEMKCCGESWADVVYCTMNDDALDYKFDVDHGIDDGGWVELWTHNRVYKACGTRSSKWIESMSRNPIRL